MIFAFIPFSKILFPKISTAGRALNTSHCFSPYKYSIATAASKPDEWVSPVAGKTHPGRHKFYQDSPPPFLRILERQL